MADPWFDPSRYAWLPGTVLGCAGGIWGALVGTLAPRGKARAFVYGCYAVLMLASAILLATGVFAWLSGQPYGIWYGFGLAGAIGLTVLGVNGPTMLRVYRQAEERRMQARDL